MSQGPIPPIGPNDLKFVPEPSDFTGLLGNELGNQGTDQDGFDEILNEASALAVGAGAVLDLADSDLADASAFLPEFDPAAPTNLLASLQPASDAADTALDQFNTDVPPDPTGGSSGSGTSGAAPQPCVAGSTVQGLVIGQPDPTPYPAVNVQHAGPLNWKNLGTICTGSTPQIITVKSGSWNANDAGDGAPDTGDLIFGDPAIFTETDTQTPDSNGGESYEVKLTITPTKAGRFQAIVEHPSGHFRSAGSGGTILSVLADTGYRITIVEPPVKPGATPVAPGGIANPPAAR